MSVCQVHSCCSMYQNFIFEKLLSKIYECSTFLLYTTCSLPIHPSVDVYAISTFWLFCMLLWSFLYKFLRRCLSITKRISESTQRILLCEALSAADAVQVLLLGTAGRAHSTSEAWDVRSQVGAAGVSLSAQANVSALVRSCSDSVWALLPVSVERGGFGLEGRFCLFPP